MNILFLNFDDAPTITHLNTSSVGGLNASIYNLSNGLAKYPQFKVYIAYRDTGLSPNEALEPRLNTIKIVCGPSRRLDNLEIDGCLKKYAEEIGKIIVKHNIDIVSTAGSEAGYCAYLLKESKVGFTWVHGTFASLVIRRVMVEGLSLEEASCDDIAKREYASVTRCDYLMARSVADAEENCNVFGINKEKVFIITPGFDPSIFFPSQSAVAREKAIIVVGRLRPNKDLPFALRAFAKARELGLGQEWTLRVIGGNDKERQDSGLLEVASLLEIEENVSFLNGVSHYELASQYRSGSFLLYSSLHEPFGIIPVEARACGLPTIIRSNNSHSRIFADNCGGYIVDRDDPSDMAKCIVDLANNEDILTRFILEAPTTVKQYSLTNVVDNYTKKIQDIIKRLN